MTGKGRSRSLAYRFSNAGRRTLTFTEVGREGRRVLGTVSAASGILRFSPGDGAGGRRKIEATVLQDGSPRERLDVASYTAPGPSRPGRVTSVRARRTKRALLVSWRGGSGASQFLVRVTVSDGRRTAYVTRARSFRVPAIARGDKVIVIVQARNARGRLGPAGRVKA